MTALTPAPHRPRSMTSIADQRSEIRFPPDSDSRVVVVATDLPRASCEASSIVWKREGGTECAAEAAAESTSVRSWLDRWSW